MQSLCNDNTDYIFFAPWGLKSNDTDRRSDWVRIYCARFVAVALSLFNSQHDSVSFKDFTLGISVFITTTIIGDKSVFFLSVENSYPYLFVIELNTSIRDSLIIKNRDCYLTLESLVSRPERPEIFWQLLVHYFPEILK